jgi:hypothetical protein
MATITDAPGMVSGTLDLANGNYVLSAKLYVTSDVDNPLVVDVTCDLMQEGTSIDHTTITVGANQSQALSLASSAVVSNNGNDEISVSCATGASDVDVEAFSIQLIAIRVSTLNVQPTPP